MIVPSPGKADGGEKVSAADAFVGGKRKATGKSERVEADDPPQHSHWLMKSEPESRFENGIDVKVSRSVPRPCFGLAVDSQVWFTFQFGIEDLKAMSDQTSCWDGVRNFQVGQSNRNAPKSPSCSPADGCDL